MPIKLKVSKINEPEKERDYALNKETISIGRDPENDLQLEGINYSVSRIHTKIIQHNDVYHIIDQNSFNFTYLNDKKLKAGVEYELNDGDQIKICEFNIQISIVITKANSPDSTQKSTVHPNPFIEDSQTLAKIIGQICKNYRIEEFPEKERKLQEALWDALSPLGSKEVGEIIAYVLTPKIKTAPLPPHQSLEKYAHTHPHSEQIHELIDILIALLIKLIQARRHFRLEFMGETMIKSKKHFSIYDCTYDELKNYILDPDISSQEAQNRIEKIRSVGEEVMFHQISMLEGYKASVNEGTKKILGKINPSLLKKQLREEKISYKVLPILGIHKLIQLVSDAHNELFQEDQGILEKKYFRPAYIHSYNIRIDSIKKKRSKQNSKMKGSKFLSKKVNK